MPTRGFRRAQSDIGLAGLAVMGQNLVLNIEGRGYAVSVFNRTRETMERFVAERCGGRNVVPCATMREFVGSLRRPRKVILMVKAGAPVDAVLANLAPLLERGDVVMDGGNSHYPDTGRRQREAQARGISFVGMGVSGGEYGALHGPSIMPGGDRKAYGKVRDILLRAAARTDDGPCCAWVGNGAAGHFTKMVHNGIEYAIMQLLAECYDIMRTGLGMGAGEAGEVFGRWDRGELGSYLVEISAKVLSVRDPETGKPLVDLILDRAEQKGTGKWTSQAALDLGVPVPTITAAVDARIISGHKEERAATARLLGGGPAAVAGGGRKGVLAALEHGLYGAMMLCYAQGLHLLARASREHGYGIRLSEVCRIWKGGCIIRARMLDLLKECFVRSPGLTHLLLSRPFVRTFRAHAGALRQVASLAARARIPVPAFSSAVAYRDSFARAVLPASLTQAQRDYFGAHTYERTDRQGAFHTEWED